MAVRLRLQRKGRKKNPFYFIVAADGRSKRDGKYIERLGSYNPMTKPATIDIDFDKALDWVNKGAQPSNTVRAILRYKGVLYKKHLLRGLAKGALTEEQVEEKFKQWLAEHADKVLDAEKKAQKEKEDYLTRVFGEAGPAPAPAAEESEEPAEAAATEEAPEAEAAEETPEAEKTEEVAEAAETAEEPKAEEKSDSEEE